MQSSNVNRQFIVFSIFGIAVLIFGSLIVILAVIVFRSAGAPLQVVSNGNPNDYSITQTTTPSVNDPVEWVWLKRSEPWQGLGGLSFLATSRPVTWKEVVNFAHAQMAADYKNGIKFGVFFDDQFGRKKIATGNGGDTNLFYHSQYDSNEFSTTINGIERSSPERRFQLWFETRMPKVIWDASYKSGHLKCSATSFEAAYDKEHQTVLRSVPEIWWLLYIYVFRSTDPHSVIVHFYDLKDLEVLIYDQPGGSKIGRFTVPRRALDAAFIVGPYPDNAMSDLQDQSFDINQ